MSIVKRVRRPIRSESQPTIGEPKKMPTSVDAAMSPLHTGVRPRSAVISGRTTAMMPRSKPSRPSPIAVAAVIRRSMPMSRPATGGATLSRSEQLRTASRYANMPRSTYCMIPPLR